MLLLRLPRPETHSHGVLLPLPLQVDLVSKEPGDAPPTSDFAALLRAMPANCDYSDMAAVTADASQ